MSIRAGSVATFARILGKLRREPDDREISAQLDSRRLVRPRFSHQQAWATRFHPHTDFDPERGAWSLLRSFTLPLTQAFATDAHRTGIRALGLDADTPPSFAEFQGRALRATGWKVVAARGEISAERYFRHLSKREFPCIARLRPVAEVLCGSRPDFWHEAVGHIAPLVDPRISDFYQRCAALHVAALERGELSRARDLEKVFWVVFEYGFLVERGEARAFGAALAGSFVALTKWRLGKWALRPFSCRDVLDSGLFEEHREPRRDAEGRLIFFAIEDLDRAYREFAAFADSAP